MKSSKVPDGQGSVYKEVRFSPTSTPIRRSRSVAGSTPAWSSKYAQGPLWQPSNQNIFATDTSYTNHSRQLLEKQRANFEAEREAFSQERRLWEKESSLLRAKIVELELLLKCQRTASSSTSILHAPLPVLGIPQFQGRRSDDFFHSAQVWEGSSPASRPTRVFRDEEVPENRLSPSIGGASASPPSLDAALSPRSQAADAAGVHMSVPVPIEKLDSRLDGITLKSTALPPGVVARVITPPTPSPLEPALADSPSTSARPNGEHRNSLKLKLSLSELGPPNENLLRNAGHTPMAIVDIDESQEPTEEPTPFPEVQEVEKAISPSVETKAEEAPQPREHADSYFPDVHDDPALKGPLGLINDQEHDNSFLNELDLKLLDQARRILGSVEVDDPNEKNQEVSNQGEPEPEIKFKKSTNFGTAFGLKSLGQF
ncbi:hypothetical protein N7495_000931 [Penicillium taxi]|uniref:uncharacterized protein n=1 Tax=Penicillium taxi TaxID=168475 RepID=UPI0025451397|nr:uncharacterized protein N7495_000931 [Penicillium taxi]KAJ5908249.1 hypothetical protein N7495_000931 [Penicillium taxi]